MKRSNNKRKHKNNTRKAKDKDRNNDSIKKEKAKDSAESVSINNSGSGSDTKAKEEVDLLKELKSCFKVTQVLSIVLKALGIDERVWYRSPACMFWSVSTVIFTMLIALNYFGINERGILFGVYESLALVSIVVYSAFTIMYVFFSYFFPKNGIVLWVARLLLVAAGVFRCTLVRSSLTNSLSSDWEAGLLVLIFTFFLFLNLRVICIIKNNTRRRKRERESEKAKYCKCTLKYLIDKLKHLVGGSFKVLEVVYVVFIFILLIIFLLTHNGIDTLANIGKLLGR